MSGVKSSKRTLWATIGASVISVMLAVALTFTKPEPPPPPPPGCGSPFTPVSVSIGTPDYLRRLVDLENRLGIINRDPDSKSPKCLQWAMEAVSKNLEGIANDSEFRVLLKDAERMGRHPEDLKRLMKEGVVFTKKFHDVEKSALMKVGVDNETAELALATVLSLQAHWSDEYNPVNANEIINDTKALATLAGQVANQIRTEENRGRTQQNVAGIAKGVLSLMVFVIDMDKEVARDSPEIAAISLSMAESGLKEALSECK